MLGPLRSRGGKGSNKWWARFQGTLSFPATHPRITWGKACHCPSLSFPIYEGRIENIQWVSTFFLVENDFESYGLSPQK